MSIADNFDFEGAFDEPWTELLFRRDVSGFDYWTTLSGYNKDARDSGQLVTDSEIRSSEYLAARFLYNIEIVSMSAEAGTSSLVDIDLLDTPSIDTGGFSNGRADPQQRVCSSGKGATRNTGNGVRAITLDLGTRVQRLYDGATDDEDNFLGFAISESILCRAVYASVDIFSYLNDSNDFLSVEDVAYVVLGGMHFVCSAKARSTSSHMPFVDAANIVARNESMLTTGDVLSTECAITNLHFFDYA